MIALRSLALWRSFSYRDRARAEKLLLAPLRPEALSAIPRAIQLLKHPDDYVWLNAAQRKDRATHEIEAASAKPPDLRLYFALCATTSPAVIWGGFGYNEARLFCRTQSAAFLLDSCALA
jgi:HEAT repeat protein